MVAPVRVTGSSIISATPSRRVMRNVRPLLSPSLLPPCKFDRAPRPRSSLRSNRRVHLAFPFVGISPKIYSSLDRVHRSIGIAFLQTASVEKKNRVLRKCKGESKGRRIRSSWRKLPIIGRIKIPWLMEIRSADSLICERNARVGREKGRVRGKAKRGRNARSVGRLLNLSLQVETLFILRARLLKLGESRS